MTYQEKLRDPRWQRKRLEIMQRDNFCCQHCRSSKNTLNVHHKLYEKGRDPWDYPDQNLITLCEDCHEKVTILIRRATLAASDPDLGQNLFNLLAHNLNGHDETLSAYLANYSPDGSYCPMRTTTPKVPIQEESDADKPIDPAQGRIWWDRIRAALDEEEGK